MSQGSPKGLTLIGDANNNTLIGSALDDTLQGNQGVDFLNGAGGNDLFIFSPDAVYKAGSLVQNSGSPGQAGSGELASVANCNFSYDVHEGGTGIDTLQLTFGNDAFSLDDSKSPFPNNIPQPRISNIEIINAGAGNDIVDLTSPSFTYGNVTINGEAGNDILWSNAGNDNLNGGEGKDRLLGGAGNDVLNGGTGSDFLNGEAGDDTLLFSIDEVYKAGTLSQNSGSPGYAGNGEITSLAGLGFSHDVYEGGAGTDTLKLTDGNDAFSLDNALSPFPDGITKARLSNVEIIEAGLGNDTVDLTSPTFTYGNVTILGGAGNDVLWSNQGNDILKGGEGNDKLFGGAGDDLVQGETGDDVLEGGAGNDILEGGQQNDTYLNFKGSFGTDKITDVSGVDTLNLSQYKSNEANIIRTGNDLRIELNGAAGNGIILIKDFVNDGLTQAANGFLENVIFSDKTLTSLSQYVLNKPPVLQSDSYNINEDTSLVITAGNGVLANDLDQNGDKLTVIGYVTKSAKGGTVSLNEDGSFVYNPAANYFGADSFSYNVSDGKGGTSAATVSLTVSGVNDAPVAVGDSVVTQEDKSVTIAALNNDSDLDGDSLIVASYDTKSAKGGTVSLNADGSFVYNPAANYFGADSFSYTISDGKGGTSSATVSLTVSGVNDAPVAVGESVVTQEDKSVTIAVLNNDSDLDGDSLTVASYDTKSAKGGTVSLNADGSFVYNPAANYFGADSFSYTVSDGKGGTSSATVSLTVNGVNDAPVAVGDSVVTQEDKSVTIAVLNNDSDLDGDSLTVASYDTKSAKGGTVSLNADGSFVYNPAANYFGADSFSYTVSDGKGGTSSATVSLTVNGVNDVPVAVGEAYTIAEDGVLSVTGKGVLANDSDIDGDILSASLIDGPSHGTLSLNSDGSFKYIPTANFNGSDSFTYTAQDSALKAGVTTVTITVTAVNDAPSDVFLSNNTIDEQSPIGTLIGSLSASDPDLGDKHTYTLLNNAGGRFALDDAGQLFVANEVALDFEMNAQYTITVKATDQSGASLTKDLTINLNDVTEKSFQGTYLVGPEGKLSVDYLFDGGQYEGQLAVFSISGMENLVPGSQEFIKEAASRALSDSKLGHIVINDINDAAKFNGDLSDGANYNKGTYQGNQSFTFNPGDKVAIMFIPNGTVQTVFNNPNAGGSLTPLFSIPQANPGQDDYMAQVNQGKSSVIYFEDMLFSNSNKDFNDFIFKLDGATPNYNPSVTPQAWYNLPLWQEILDYAGLGTGNSTVWIGDAGNNNLKYSIDGQYASEKYVENVGSPGFPGTNEKVLVAGKNVSFDVYDGKGGLDTLNLSGASDVISLDDSLNPHPNLNGGPRLVSIETINAGAGDDVVDLTSLQYQYGDITINGADGNDILWSNAGNDLLHGDAGNDKLYGGAGNDQLYGDAGNDHLNGAYGDLDKLYGGAGNDTLLDGDGVAAAFGGDGADIFDLAFQSGWKNNATELLGSIRGEGGNDLISLKLSSSNFTIEVYGDYQEGTTGSGGAEGDGTDVVKVFGTYKQALVYLDSSQTTNQGDDGDDLFYGEGDSAGITNTLGASGGKDIVYGNGGNDTIYGGYGDDSLYGGIGNDKLFGDSGNDFLEGGAGNDELRGGLGNDLYKFASGFGQDWVNDLGGSTDKLDLTSFSKSGVNWQAIDSNDNGFFDSLLIKVSGQAVEVQNYFDDTSAAKAGIGVIESIQFSNQTFDFNAVVDQVF